MIACFTVPYIKYNEWVDVYLLKYEDINEHRDVYAFKCSESLEIITSNLLCSWMQSCLYL